MKQLSVRCFENIQSFLAAQVGHARLPGRGLVNQARSAHLHRRHAHIADAVLPPAGLKGTESAGQIDGLPQQAETGSGDRAIYRETRFFQFIWIFGESHNKRMPRTPNLVQRFGLAQLVELGLNAGLQISLLL